MVRQAEHELKILRDRAPEHANVQRSRLTKWIRDTEAVREANRMAFPTELQSRVFYPAGGRRWVSHRVLCRKF